MVEGWWEIRCLDPKVRSALEHEWWDGGRDPQGPDWTVAQEWSGHLATEWEAVWVEVRRREVRTFGGDDG